MLGGNISVVHRDSGDTSTDIATQSAGELVSAGADIVIGAGYVSARHARFSLMGQNLFVEDLGSTNGTLVNGQRISDPVGLNNNDVVTVGDVSIRVRRS